MNLSKSPIFILACALCIAAAPRKQVCPLQCFCNKRPDLWIDVHCPRSNFSSVPQFPDHTISITIKVQAKLRRIQSNAFSNLMHLEVLYIWSNVPWTLSETAFRKLANLKSLHLGTTHSNPLSDDAFADLTSVTNLYLSTKLINIPHRAICKFRKLHHLGLSHNGLKRVTLDQCFSSMSSLTLLDLTGNRLRVLNGSEFEALRSTKLETFRLDDCQLTEIGPDTFLYTSHLKTLSLSKNKLTFLPPGIFRGLEALKFLSLHTNLLRTIPCAALEPLINIVELNLNFNNMTNFTVCPEFRNFTGLRTLYMVADRISRMESDFFHNLGTSNLTTLFLSVRRLSPLALLPLKDLQHLKLLGMINNSTYLQYAMQGLVGSDIRVIEAINLGLAGIIGEDMFISLAKSNLSKLMIQNSLIKGVSVDAFSPLSKLEMLNLSHNRITDFPLGTFRKLVALKHIILSNNLINTAAVDRWCLQESLRELYLQHNYIRRIEQFTLKGLAKLERLNLNNNILEGIAKNSFAGTNLKSLSLSMNDLKSLPNELFNTTKHLENIRIEQNEVLLTNALNPKGLFAELKNITIISLTNVLIERNYEHFGHFFNNLTHLLSLTLTGWKLQVLPVTLFLGTHHLDFLVLANNEIASWDPKLFQPLYELTSLELNRNKIVSISKEAFSYIPKLRRLDLSENALACNCELMWFREWIETTFIYIPNVKNKHSYHCEAPERFKGVAFLDFSLSETDCIVFSLVKLSVTFSSVIVLLLIAAGLVYRFRFEVQMFMFYVRSRQQRLLDGIDTLEYVYDAYVIYSSGDRRWVLDKLMAYLESSRGYRLCIEDRDWLGGRAIVDNIIESIESSRRVILVLSIEFVRNSWCVETAEMAQSHLLNRNKNTLIPILLADIPPENLPPSIRSVFATRTLLPWPKGDTNKRKQDRKEDKFWKTLNTALKKIVRQNVSGRLDQGVGADNEISSGDDI